MRGHNCCRYVLAGAPGTDIRRGISFMGAIGRGMVLSTVVTASGATMDNTYNVLHLQISFYMDNFIYDILVRVHVPLQSYVSAWLSMLNSRVRRRRRRRSRALSRPRRSCRRRRTRSLSPFPPTPPPSPSPDPPPPDELLYCWRCDGTYFRIWRDASRQPYYICHCGARART